MFMIKSLLLIVLLLPSYPAKAQDTTMWKPVTLNEQKQIDSIKGTLPTVLQPSGGQFNSLCIFIERKDYAYEDRLWLMSGINSGDSRLVIIAKVQKMMYNNWKSCKCNSTSFGVRDGNLLKYSVNRKFENFVDDMVETYGIDINRIDPSDGKTLLDFMDYEIALYKKLSNSADRVKELEGISAHFVKDYSAKRARDLKL